MEINQRCYSHYSNNQGVDFISMQKPENRYNNDTNKNDDIIKTRKPVKVKKTIETEIGKNTGERDKYKKEPFFEGQSGDDPSDGVSRIEPPYASGRKPNVPGDERNSHQNSCF